MFCVCGTQGVIAQPTHRAVGVIVLAFNQLAQLVYQVWHLCQLPLDRLLEHMVDALAVVVGPRAATRTCNDILLHQGSNALIEILDERWRTFYKNTTTKLVDGGIEADLSSHVTRPSVPNSEFIRRLRTSLDEPNSSLSLCTTFSFRCREHATVETRGKKCLKHFRTANSSSALVLTAASCSQSA